LVVQAGGVGGEGVGGTGTGAGAGGVVHATAPTVEVEFGGQLVHEEEPEALEYVPIGQLVQLVAPDTAA